MAMYLAEISFLLTLALGAAGLVLWHRGREANAGPVRAAGAILVAGAVLTVLCNGYFSVRYHVQGEFDHAYPHPAAMAGRMLGVPMPTASAADGTSLSATPPGHEEHHPDGSHED